MKHLSDVVFLFAKAPRGNPDAIRHLWTSVATNGKTANRPSIENYLEMNRIEQVH
jgi:hypothetical protein